MKKKNRVRPAHILRMCNRLSKIFPDLDFTNIVTIDLEQMQTRFEAPHLAGCYHTDSKDIFVGLPEIRQDFFTKFEYASVANTLLHEVIHRKQYSINPKSKAHGKLFQKLCLKYGLDPRIEIKGDEGQKLKVKVPYPIGAWRSGGGLITDDYQDFYERDDVDDDVFIASKSLSRRNKTPYFTNEDDFLEHVSDVYLHRYHQHYPSYRLFDHIVSNYHVGKNSTSESVSPSN